MTTLFISDLHLDDRRPESTTWFLKFLQDEAVEAAALYILGDLFEYWLGDDVKTPCGEQVAEALSRLNDLGVPVYFQHGNRDFLIRESYAKQAGMTLLPEELVVDLYGEDVLLMHGDSMCTDDIPYQQFRSLVRDKDWQDNFLGKPPAERLQIAMQARDASGEHKGNVSMDIMDVNLQQVVSALARHDVSKMIHGHTHRPATHNFNADGLAAQRIVLGDWYAGPSVLRVSADGYELQK
jgi:UDP-2,3-diacylglucosamine hydrolase